MHAAVRLSRLFLYAAMGAAGLIASGSLRAAAAGADASADLLEPARALEAIVVVAQRRPEPLAQVASSVTLIDRQQFESRLAVDAADLLRWTPGLRMDVEPQRFGLQGVSIRGLGGNRVRVEIDGVPLPEAFSVGQFAAAGRDPGELATLDRIEVLRGPASMLYGSDALAGIVALHTRTAADLLDGETGYAGELSAGYAGRNASRHLSLAQALTAESGTDALLILSRRGFGTAGNQGRTPAEVANPTDGEADSLLLKLGKTIRDAGHLQLVAEHQRHATRTDVQSQRFAPGRFLTTYALYADDRQTRDRLSLHGSSDAPALGFSQWDVVLYAQDSQTRQDTEQYRLADRATPFDSLRWRRFELEQRDLGLDLLAQRTWATERTTHTLLTGVELERTRYRGQRDGYEQNLRSAAVSGVVLGERFPVRDFPTSISTRRALFVQDEIQSGDWSLIPGLRFDQVSLDVRPDALFREDYPDVEVVDSREHSLTGKLGLRYALRADHQLFAQYARGFRAPPFSDLNIGLSLTLLNYEVRPNPDLRPETSHGLELGWRYTGETLRATVSVYRNDYRDLIESRANLGVDPDTGALVFQSVNRDRARIQGVEAELEWHLDALHPMLQGWRVQAALGSAQGRDRRRNRPLDSIEPDTAVLGLGWHGAQGDRGAELMLTAVRAQDDLDPSLFAAPGHTVLDAFAWWQLHPRLRLNLGMYNVADRRYWRHASVRGLPANTPNLGFYTQPGRNASVALQWRF